MNDDSFAIGLPELRSGPSPSPWLSSLLHFWVVLSVVAATAAIVVPNLPPRHGCGGQLTACRSNCKNIATALEMYAADNHGHYPRNLEQLTVGNYLKLLPTCPAVGRMTYTNYHVSQKPDTYRFACVGDNHARSYAVYGKPSNNCPRYNSESGLVGHP